MSDQITNSSSGRATVTVAQTGWRADRALGALVTTLNRRAAKLLFHARKVRLNGRTANGAERVAAGDEFEFPAPGSQVLESLLNE
ncbi:MAG: hypothetical protein V1899_04430, partial [Planctomycetota bacterium]